MNVEADGTAQAADGFGIDEEVVARRRGVAVAPRNGGAPRPDMFNMAAARSNGSRASRKSGKSRHCVRSYARHAAQAFDRPVLVDVTGALGAARSPERSAHAFRRILQLGLQPPTERIAEQPLSLSLGQHRETADRPALLRDAREEGQRRNREWC